MLKIFSCFVFYKLNAGRYIFVLSYENEFLQNTLTCYAHTYILKKSESPGCLPYDKVMFTLCELA